MILLDSNIIIYLRDPKVSQKLVTRIPGQRLHSCNVIIAEVLGYSQLQAEDERYFEQLFSAMKIHNFDEAVTKQVIKLRRTMSIQLPDAIIAATAMVNNLTLWTHNSGDFQLVPDLKWIDPL